MTCIFCQIVKGEIPANIIYQDEHVLVFDDIYPKAPQHKLIIPRKHIATLNDLADDEAWLGGHMLKVAKNMAFSLGIAEGGYRVLLNCNPDGGQVVYHLHMHLIGGRKMQWPLG